MRSLCLWACFVTLSAVPLRAHSQADESSYDALVREAVVEYNAGNWGEARLLFGKAHELQPNARTWRGMGLTDYESKRYVEAIHELEAALASTVKRLTQTQREEVDDALDRSRRFVAIYTLNLPSDATGLRLDGKPVIAGSDGRLQLNPGTYVLRVHRASGAPFELRFEAEVGARGTLELEAEASEASRASEPGRMRTAPVHEAEGGRVWTWVAGGATVGFGAASIVFGLLALDANDTFNERTAAGQPAQEAKRDGQRYQLLTNIGLGVTAAAAITTAVLFVVEGASEDERAEAKGPQLQLGLGTIVVRGTL